MPVGVMGVGFRFTTVLVRVVVVFCRMAALYRLGVRLIVLTRRCLRLVVVGLARRRTIRLPGNNRAPLVMLVVMIVLVFLLTVHFVHPSDFQALLYS